MRNLIFIIPLVVSCASTPPVIIQCEQPDASLIIPLMFPEAENLGELEDALVQFVRKTLPEDNARKSELLRQLETLRQPR